MPSASWVNSVDADNKVASLHVLCLLKVNCRAESKLRLQHQVLGNCYAALLPMGLYAQSQADVCSNP